MRAEVSSHLIIRLSVLVLVTVLFFPLPFALTGSLRIIVVGMGLVCVLAIALFSKLRSLALIFIAFAFCLYALIFLTFSIGGADAIGDATLLLNLQRLMVVTPLFIGLGYLLGTTGTLTSFRNCLVASGVIASLGAIVERLLGRSLIGRDDFLDSQREGMIRAIFLSENVLVLGAMLAVLIPVAATLRSKLGLVSIIVLLAGAWATGSRGPTVAGIMVAITCLAPHARAWLINHHRVVRVSTVVVISVILFFSFFIWTVEIPGVTGLAYSLWYRPAIYAFLPLVLLQYPFGYGLRSIPEGQWLMASESRGVRDAAATFDSELVYSAFSFGWIGVLLYVSALLVGAAAIRYDFYVGMSTLLMGIIGLFLALHAWDTIGPLWYLLIGMSLATIHRREDLAQAHVFSSKRMLHSGNYIRLHRNVEDN